MMMMENDDKEEKEEEEEEPQQTGQKAYVDFKRMLRGDAYKFLGGCLIGVSDPLQFARDTFERWVRKIQPIKRLMEKYERDKNELAKEIRSIEEEVIHFDKRLGKTDENEKKNDKTERYTGLSKEQKISKLQSEKEPRL